MTTVVTLWLKVFVFTFILVWFLGIPQVGASPDYSGNWCKEYDDFTRVMLITNNGDLEELSFGNQAGEKLPSVFGFISRGASSCQMNIEGQDMGVVDCRTRKILGDLTLILSYSDGHEDRFKKCTYAQMMKVTATP